MPRLMVSLLIIFMSLGPVSGFERNGKSIVSEFTLDNGLQLIVIPDRRAPVVTHMIWYKVGAADDPPGKSGIAHFLEHLLFKGTTNVPAGEFSAAIASIGGQENAFTSSDYTAYYQKVSPNALETMMTYEADRMQNVILSDEVVYPERDVILEERSGRVDNSPAAILSEFVQSAIYVHHPYGIPVIGWEHEIAKLERDEILEFYRKWYQPWNAIVVVAGDVEPQSVLKLAKETYGKLVATSPKIERSRTSDPEPVVKKRLEYRDERVTNPVWQRIFRAPSYETAENGEAEALDILSTVLGDSVSSRIYKEVILEQEVATSAGAFYRGSSRDNGYFGLYASPRGETTVSELETLMEKQIDRLLKEGVTEAEVERAKKSLIKSIIFSQDSQVTLARIFGATLATGGSVELINGWEDRLRKVSVDDVNSVARRYLARDRSVTSVLRPEEG